MKLAVHLALTDLLLQYRRSTLGPLWVSLTLFVQVSVIGLLFSALFNADTFSYLLYLGTGLITWTAVVSSINESTQSLIGAGSLIRQVALPYQTHALRVLFKNFFLFCHNLLALVPFYILANSSISWWTFALIPGVAVLLLNLSWITVLASVVSARYRDTPAIIAAALTIGFYVTPILWSTEQIEGSRIAPAVPYNPLYHIIQVVREPLIGNPVPAESFLIALVGGLAGWGLTKTILKSKSKLIPFWV